jgi:type IV pilus assembly protein PilV
MMRRRSPRVSRPLVERQARSQSGFTMIEVLVTFVILVVGLLGLIGLQARAQQAELESYQRGQALILLQDMVDRMNANRLGSKSGNYLTTGMSPAYVGSGATSPTPLSTCVAPTSPATIAAYDLCEWGNELIGAAEVTASGTCTSTDGTNCIGAMLGARGCVSYDAATELADSTGAVIPGTGIITITVAWQGVVPTIAPPAAITCAQNAYPAETQRRVVTATLRMGSLTAQ